MMDLIWMVEEDSTGLIREQHVFNQAFDFVDVIERELMALMDEISWLLSRIKGPVRKILHIHVQSPDTLTIEVMLA